MQPPFLDQRDDERSVEEGGGVGAGVECVWGVGWRGWEGRGGTPGNRKHLPTSDTKRDIGSSRWDRRRVIFVFQF